MLALIGRGGDVSYICPEHKMLKVENWTVGFPACDARELSGPQPMS